MITADRLREVLSYNPDTGEFVWQKNTGKKRLVGRRAGHSCPSHEGRVVIRVDKRMYQASRLVWLYVHGHWPAEDIDHINGDPTDNRLSNLREATRRQNMANKRRHKNNTSGVKGVHFHRQSGKWRAVVRFCGKNQNVGLFDDKEVAGRAYFAAAQKLFGEFATTRG